MISAVIVPHTLINQSVNNHLKKYDIVALCLIYVKESHTKLITIFSLFLLRFTHFV